MALPSILGALLAFGVIIGPAYALAMEREDGTLLRHKALPHGMQGYVTGQLLYHSLGLVPAAAGHPRAELPALRRPDEQRRWPAG